MSVSDQLKAAVEKAEAKGETRYKIAQESRVDYTVLVRFLDLGTSIRLQTVDRLCEHLGLELRRCAKITCAISGGCGRTK